jgi:flagellar motility protein MotE (MotC chaperone)
VADVKAREERLERRQAQMDLVLRDLRAEQDAVDDLGRRVTAAVQAAATAAREAAAAPPAAKLPDPNAADPDAIRRMATMYDNMTPESAALILKQMADSGKLDTAVRILSQMQPRQASRVLAEIEPELAAQLLEKMRTLKKAAAPATPAPAGVTSNVPTAVVPPRPTTP